MSNFDENAANKVVEVLDQHNLDSFESAMVCFAVALGCSPDTDKARQLFEAIAEGLE